MSPSNRAIYIVVSAALFSFCAHAGAGEAGGDAPLGADVASVDLSTKTDTELTELMARWGELSAGQRREVLAEVHGRMEVNRNKARRPSGVRVERQYGRVVRKSDGSVLVQTRVVQMRPRGSSAGESSRPRSTVTFGIGFEQRSRTRPAQGPLPVQSSDEHAAEVPGVKVGQQPTPPDAP